MEIILQIIRIENIQQLFDRYSKEIAELQRNGLFNEQNNQYLPGLERLIELYQQKKQEYVVVIDKITEEDIQRNLSEGRDYETSKRFAQKIPNIYKAELYEQENRIITQRESQIRLLEVPIDQRREHEVFDDSSIKKSGVEKNFNPTLSPQKALEVSDSISEFTSQAREDNEERQNDETNKGRDD